REKKFSLSPQAPLSLSRKAEYFCAFRLRLLCNSTPRQVRWAAQNTRFAVGYFSRYEWCVFFALF
ncbi:MAG: hypothetical protein J6S24_02280, partial [Lentisphaeria bacterium]|nr:hypothetical protein [Lentisphaeria bacterium]